MGNVTFIIEPRVRRGKKMMRMDAPLYVRYQKGRLKNGGVDIRCATYVEVAPVNWNNNKNKVKYSVTAYKPDETNLLLDELKVHIKNVAKDHVLKRIPLNDTFLKNAVDDFFKVQRRTEKETERANDRITSVNDRKTYLAVFMKDWIDNKMDTYIKKKDNKPLTKSSKDLYKWVYKKLLKYEDFKKKRIKFSGLNGDTQDRIISCYLNEIDLNQSSVNIIITRWKFMIELAKKEDIDVHKDFPNNAFIEKRVEDKKWPVLDFEEIKNIYDHNFSYNKYLDSLRDWFIIGLNTGMRISDFYITLDFDEHVKKVLSTDNDGSPKAEFVIQKKSQKTGVEFAAPGLEMVAEILEKWGGLPPRKVLKDVGSMKNEFNKGIREICRLVGINEEIEVEHWDADKKRMVHGKCEKWESVTSHICRRSFATNMDGIMAGEDIDAICGWKTDKQRKLYNKTTLRTRADRAKKAFLEYQLKKNDSKAA